MYIQSKVNLSKIDNFFKYEWEFIIIIHNWITTNDVHDNMLIIKNTTLMKAGNGNIKNIKKKK